MKKAFVIRVTGKVQGVFFRASTKEKADKLGVAGNVRNERDGSVLIHAEGDEKDLAEFVAWCRQGPPHAVVQQLDLSDVPVAGFGNFQIIR